MAKRKYQITVSRNGQHPKGEALLITNQGDGYLWLGNEEGNCIGWIDNRQLDAISKAWLRVREGGTTTLALDGGNAAQVEVKSNSKVARKSRRK